MKKTAKDYTKEEKSIILSASNEEEAVSLMAKSFPERSAKGVRQKFYSLKREVEVMDIISNSSSEEEAISNVSKLHSKYPESKVKKKYFQLTLKREAREKQRESLQKVTPDFLSEVVNTPNSIVVFQDDLKITVTVEKV